MKICYEQGLCRCKCGGKPRYRYREPFHWVECQAKKCEERTRYYKDIKGRFDLEAKDRAFKEWNERINTALLRHSIALFQNDII